MAVLKIQLGDEEIEMDTHQVDRKITPWESTFCFRVSRYPLHLVSGTEGRLIDGRSYKVLSVKSPLCAEKEELYRNDSLTHTSAKTEKVTITSRKEIPHGGGYIYSYRYQEEEYRNVPEAELLKFITTL